MQNPSISIHPNINAALQEIFDIIILNYVNSWYLGFSNNEDFIIEVKYFCHTICTEILLRISKIDIPNLITQKLLPVIINHLEICYTIQHSNDNTNTVVPVQELLLQKMKSHLHIAMIGRKEEVAYLKSVSKFLIPNLTPDYVSQTDNKSCFHLLEECLTGTVLLPAMDSIASPDLINKFICLLLDSSSPTTIVPLNQSTAHVTVLHRYQKAWIERLGSQNVHPRGIEYFLRDDKYLYHFLRYIKSIDAIAPVNFFMLMDSITVRLLNPEIDGATKIHIFDDLQRLEDLMKSCDEYSDLNISANLHERVKEIISGGHENVILLINCDIWIQNYNSVCQHIQSLYLSQYFESEFFLSTIYGDRQSDIETSDKQKEFSMTKFGTSIKNALSFNSDDSVDSISGDVELENCESTDQMTWVDKNDSYSSGLVDLPDLSNLRVKIPSISQPFLNNKTKTEFCFSVSTYKIDSDELLYKVHRKYGEFYVLEQKLIEFHGNIGRNLPPKKPWDNKKLDFLDNRKFEFETYLLFLVNRPFLKNSQLLYRFLTSQSEFNINTLIDINLGRFVKNMPMKLAKERGQFLDQFLNNFHVSCESPTHTKSYSNYDLNSSFTNSFIEPQNRSMIDTRMHSRMFWNNAEFINVKCENLMDDICTFSTRYIFYFFDAFCIFFQIVTNKLSFSHLILSVLYRIRLIFDGWLQLYIINMIKRGIEKLCFEKVAVEIIHTLRDVALLAGFSRTNAEKLERRDQALMLIRQMLPEFLMMWLPSIQKQSIYANIDRIFDCLQQPKLNKQLSYVLLDIVLLELFPELADNLAHIPSELPNVK